MFSAAVPEDVNELQHKTLFYDRGFRSVMSHRQKFKYRNIDVFSKLSMLANLLVFKTRSTIAR